VAYKLQALKVILIKMPLTSEEDKEALMEKHTRLNINKQ